MCLRLRGMRRKQSHSSLHVYVDDILIARVSSIFVCCTLCFSCVVVFTRDKTRVGRISEDVDEEEEE